MSVDGDASAETPHLLVLSGPSGTGKTTLVNQLLEHSPIPLRKTVSATTRAPRAGERHGEDYWFLDAREFARRRQAGEFLECAEVHGSGNWYGTLRSEIEDAGREGRWALLEIDVQGAMSVIHEFPGALTIFLKTPSAEEYERRLRSRGTESEEVIRRRLQTAERELQGADQYRFQVVNDSLDRAVAEISEILRVTADLPTTAQE